jgi:FkbM family methyltransferase
MLSFEFRGERHGDGHVMAGMKKPLLYRIYQVSLTRYLQQKERNTLYCRSYERLIRWLVLLLSAARRLTFPARVTGGWWWIWRWRFEVLMGWFEMECACHCRNLIPPGGTVVDIGGHIGLYSRLFSRIVGPRGRVLVFEANPENIAVLRSNLRGRRYRNVEIVWSAVSSSDGVVRLHVSPGHSNHSLLRGYTEATEIIEVPSVSIDSFLKQRGIGSVDFVKSDTEGAEPLVIEGMESTILSSPGMAMLLEYNPKAISCGNFPPAEFPAFLRSKGFDVKAVGPDGSLSDHIPMLSGSEYINLLCLRRQ